MTGMGAITPLGLNVEEFWTEREGREELDLAESNPVLTQLNTEPIMAAESQQASMRKDYMDFKAAKTNGTVQPVCGGGGKGSHRAVRPLSMTEDRSPTG